MEALINFIHSESFVDGVFIAMLTFVILCHIFPRFVARQQSNPYTIQAQWNFGVESFNFQLLNYDIYHSNIVSRWSHHLTITLESMLWIMVIRITFGFYLSLAVLSILLVQSISFGDFKFGAVMGSIWISMTVIAEIILSTTDISVSSFKILILYSVFIRTISHVLEVVPPLVNGDHDKFSKEIALWFAFTDPWGAFKALILGNLSEMASAIPGRLFPVVVYLVLNHLGYRSSILESVPETMQRSNQILRSGWSSYHVTAKLYSWALPGGKGISGKAPHA